MIDALLAQAHLTVSPIQVMIVLVLMALNKYLRDQWSMPSKWAVAVNLAVGVIYNVVVSYGKTDIPQALLLGFLLGSFASGLYDITKLFKPQT